LKSSYVSTFHNLFGHNNNRGHPQQQQQQQFPQQLAPQFADARHSNSHFNKSALLEQGVPATPRRKIHLHGQQHPHLVGRPRNNNQAPPTLQGEEQVLQQQQQHQAEDRQDNNDSSGVQQQAEELEESPAAAAAAEEVDNDAAGHQQQRRRRKRQTYNRMPGMFGVDGGAFYLEKVSNI